MIRTAMGLKSKPPKLGRLRRMGPRIGSVTWFTKALIVIKMGWGLPALIWVMKERMTRANMVIVKRVSIALRNPANV